MRERERERERVCVCVFVRAGECVSVRVCAHCAVSSRAKRERGLVGGEKRGVGGETGKDARDGKGGGGDQTIPASASVKCENGYRRDSPSLTELLVNQHHNA